MNLTQCIRAGDKDSRDGYIISFVYDEQGVETLKRSIPHTDREWHPESKTWWVSKDYELQLKSLFPNFEALLYLQGKLWSQYEWGEDEMKRIYCDDTNCQNFGSNPSDPFNDDYMCRLGFLNKFRVPKSYADIRNCDWGYVMPKICRVKYKFGRR